MDFESSLQKFATRFTSEIQTVEYGIRKRNLVNTETKFKKIKNSIMEIRDFKKQIETKMNNLECAVEVNEVRLDNLVKGKTEKANQISALQVHIKDSKEKQETDNNANTHVIAYMLIEISKCFQNCDFLKQRTEALCSKFPYLQPMTGQYCVPMQFQFGPQGQIFQQRPA